MLLLAACQKSTQAEAHMIWMHTLVQRQGQENTSSMRVPISNRTSNINKNTRTIGSHTCSNSLLIKTMSKRFSPTPHSASASCHRCVIITQTIEACTSNRSHLRQDWLHRGFLADRDWGREVQWNTAAVDELEEVALRVFQGLFEMPTCL